MKLSQKMISEIECKTIDRMDVIKKDMPRVYVAGSYSASNILDVLENMRKGIRLSTKVFQLGMAPFSPWLDFQFALSINDGDKLTVDQFYNYSTAWLRASDCLLLVPGWEDSVGTKNEIKIAKKMGIPIFHKIEELIEWSKK